MRIVPRFLSLLGIACVTACSHATTVGIAAAKISTFEESEFRGLNGVEVSVARTLTDSAWNLRLGVTTAARAFNWYGTLCGGMIPPTGCEPEPNRGKRTLTVASAGIGRTLMRRPSSRVDLLADVLLGNARIADRQLVSDGERSRNTPAIGARAGLDAFWWPTRRAPVALKVGIAGEAIKPLVVDCLDCWMPFNGGFTTRRFTLGLSLGAHP